MGERRRQQSAASSSARSRGGESGRGGYARHGIRGRLGRGSASKTLENGGDRFCLDIAYGNRFGEPAGAVENVRDLVSADVPLGMDELGEAVPVEGDAPLGESEVVVHAEQGGEHAGRLALCVGFEVGQGGGVQVLYPSGYLGGREVEQSGAFTVLGSGPPRHVAVLGRRRSGAGR